MPGLLVVLGVAGGLGHLPQPLLQALGYRNQLALGVVGIVQLALLQGERQDAGRPLPASAKVINCA